MRLYGTCDDEQRPWSIVEGDLIKWRFVIEVGCNSNPQGAGLQALCYAGEMYSVCKLTARSQRNLPWCFRVDLAIQVMTLSKFWDDLGLMHCDWKCVYPPGGCHSPSPAVSRTYEFYPAVPPSCTFLSFIPSYTIYWPS